MTTSFYFASHGTDLLLSAASLDTVLTELSLTSDRDCDVAIWHASRLVAVRQANGIVLHLDPTAGDDDGRGVDLAALASGRVAADDGDDDELPFCGGGK
jgi:hypothetical protein